MIDLVDIERRKASWSWAFARWLANTAPFLWKLGVQCFLVANFGFFVGTAIVIQLLGLNLLLSIIIAELATFIGLYVYWKTGRQSRNR